MARILQDSIKMTFKLKMSKMLSGAAELKLIKIISVIIMQMCIKVGVTLNFQKSKQSKMNSEIFYVLECINKRIK
jgi:hypothetical protein